MPIQAREAALSAKKYLAETMGELPGLLLDEVEKMGNTWKVSVSFYESMFQIARVHRVLAIDADSGNVISMKNKNSQ